MLMIPFSDKHWSYEMPKRTKFIYDKLKDIYEAMDEIKFDLIPHQMYGVFSCFSKVPLRAVIHDTNCDVIKSQNGNNSSPSYISTYTVLFWFVNENKFYTTSVCLKMESINIKDIN